VDAHLDPHPELGRRPFLQNTRICRRSRSDTAPIEATVGQVGAGRLDPQLRNSARGRPRLRARALFQPHHARRLDRGHHRRARRPSDWSTCSSEFASTISCKPASRSLTSRGAVGDRGHVAKRSTAGTPDVLGAIPETTVADAGQRPAWLRGVPPQARLGHSHLPCPDRSRSCNRHHNSRQRGPVATSRSRCVCLQHSKTAGTFSSRWTTSACLSKSRIRSRS
jgi:hypothetical protein